MNLKDIDGFVERQIAKRFPDDMDIPIAQLRVRIAQLCIEVMDKVNLAASRARCHSCGAERYPLE